MGVKLKLSHGFSKQLMFILFAGLGCTSAYANPKGYVLNIELSPALCKIENAQKRMRQCLEGYSLSVAGLYPIEHSRPCQTSNSLVLTPVQKRVLMRIMPDENVQMRLWRDVGGCIAMSSQQYVRLMVTYAERLKIAEEFSTASNLKVNRDWLEKRFIQQNAGMTHKTFNFSCGTLSRNTTVLTKIQVCYKSDGRYGECPTTPIESCPDQFMIQGSY